MYIYQTHLKRLLPFVHFPRENSNMSHHPGQILLKHKNLIFFNIKQKYISTLAKDLPKTPNTIPCLKLNRMAIYNNQRLSIFEQVSFGII